MEKRGNQGTPLVAASGQGWKVTLGLGGIGLAAAASIYQFVGPARLKMAAIAVAIVSGLLGIAALLAVRCPSCRRSLGLWAFQSGSLTTWHEKLAEVPACPHCGHVAGEGGRRR